jgi:hypothetical protein
MEKKQIFSANIGKNFEESIRVDRDRDGGIESESHPLRTYHLTQESREFLDDFFTRLTDSSNEMRKGSNHWLYGYYGSGKSHLLSVLGFLTDSDQVDVDEKTKEKYWKVLAEDRDYEDLRTRWYEATHENYLVPVSINLLKYQGAEEVSLSQILSRAIHTEQDLSSRLEVAHFEKWFRGKEEWEKRDELARKIAENKGIELDEEINWQDHVRNYKALSDLVLPEIFEKITGSREGYQDLTPDRLGPEKTVEQIEEWRQELQQKKDRDVKIILLLDEVSLFMGSDFDKLTELNSLAEKIDDIGQGNIQLVATAQESVEEVHKDLASKGPGFSIVKDRFPHRYNLPSKHASEIVRNRLLKKTPSGKGHIKEILNSVTLDPATQFGYTEIGKDTSPSLNTIDDDLFIDYYPALPYLTPLFMEILANMRESTADSSKSVFSGTTRAILAIIHGLLNEWEENSEETELINLVDFFDLIRYEVEEVAEREEKVIKKIEDNFEEDSRALNLAKVIFLLNQVPDFIPANDENLAIGIMNDLKGKTRNQMLGEVDKALEELEEFIKEDGEEDKRFRFTTPQEREIYQKKERKLKESDWDEIIDTVDKKIFSKALEQINLPARKKLSKKGEEFKVNYTFSTPQREMETIYGDKSGLEIPVILSGLQPDENEPKAESGKIIWQAQDEGKEDIRKRIKEWWALEEAYGSSNASPYLENELEKKKDSAVDGLARLLKNSSYKVREKDLTSLGEAIEECVKQRYFGSFHPLMTKISSDNLRELKSLEKGEKLPEWALKIQVPPNRDEVTLEDEKIMNTVRATTGQKLREHDSLNLNTIIDYLADKEPLYEECEPAVLAILWGLSRNREDFMPVNESGDRLEYESILEISRTHQVRLKIDETSSEELSKVLQEHGFQDTTETKDHGIKNLRNEAEKVERQLDNLLSEIELVQDDVRAEGVQKLIQNAHKYFSDEKKEIKEIQESMRSDVPDYVDIAKLVREKDESVDTFGSELEYRKKRLLQTDILLNLAQNVWSSDETSSSADNVKQDLNQEKGSRWWREDEWARLTSQIRDYELKDSIDQDWTDFKDSHNIEDLRELIESSSINEFSKASPALRKNYVIPAKNFYNDINRIEEGLDIILSESEEQESRMLEAQKKIENSNMGVYDLKKLRENMEELIGLSASLSDVKFAGIWPDDMTNLRKALKKSLEEDKTEIEEVDGGLIIK